jgi:asparagine synthetase B (glutamine-hydrolysing)
MCAIAAIFNYRSGEPIARDELVRIRDYMPPRGPDRFGSLPPEVSSPVDL